MTESKKGKGLAKEHTGLTHGHKQQCGEGQREGGQGLGGGRQREGWKVGTSVIVSIIKIKKKCKKKFTCSLYQKPDLKKIEKILSVHFYIEALDINFITLF